jgi:cell wall-associated NlpC family hydrolase
VPPLRENFTGASPWPVVAKVVGCSCRPDPSDHLVGGGGKGARHYVDTHPVAKLSLARRCATIAVAALAAAGLLTVAGSAGAQPQPTVSQVQAKLKKLTLKEDWLIQRYDQATQDLASARQRLKLVDREVAKDEAAATAMRDEIASIASNVYMNGAMSSVAALLTSGDPETLLSQSAILTHLSSDQYQQLQQVITTDRQLAGARQVAKRTEQAVQKLQKQLGSQRASLDKVITQQKALLASLTPPQRQQQLGGGTTTTTPKATGSGGGHYTGPTGTQAQKAVAFAYGALGCPYVYGATGPCGSGYDCSGLTMSAWASAGVSIPRTSYGQATLPAVSRSALQPGDILEFAGDSHVGIYVGGGMLIDAPQPGMNVEKVSLSTGWYAANFDGAYRP